MNKYLVYGFSVKSDFKLNCTELKKQNEVHEAWECEIKDGQVPIEREIKEEQALIDVEIKFGQAPTEIKDKIKKGIFHEFSKKLGWFYIKEVGIFIIEGGNKITVEIMSDISESTKVDCASLEEKISIFILGTSMGCLMLQRETIAIHGGTVVMGDKCIIISGDTGAGKSTIVSEIIRKGHKFLTDDISRVVKVKDKWFVVPGIPTRKLCRDGMIRFGYDVENHKRFDEFRDKFIVYCEEDFCKTPMELEKIYFIEKMDKINNILNEVEFININGSQKISFLLNNIYRIEIGREVGLSKTFMRGLINLANSTKITRVIRVSTKDTVSTITKVVTGE